MNKITTLVLVLVMSGCAQVQPDIMSDKAIKTMSHMRNPVCRQVGSYLYCHEQ